MNAPGACELALLQYAAYMHGRKTSRRAWAYAAQRFVLPTCENVIFMSEHEGHVGKLAVVGTSAGGYMAYRYALDYTDTVNALLLMAPAYTPTEADLDKLEAAGFPILHLKSTHDEMLTYEEYTAPVRAKLDSMSNMTNVCTDWVRNGDGGVASLFFGIEMGQHCICSSVGQDMMFDDGKPMEQQIPNGITGWFKEVLA